MVFGGTGVAAWAGLFMLALAGLLGTVLLVWWGWRVWHARHGRSRPPLRRWQWGLVVALSILPLFSGISLASRAWQDWMQERSEVRDNRLRYETLAQDAQWGDISAPRGSHVQFELHDEGTDGFTRMPRAVRFSRSVQVGDIWTNAMSLYPPVFELARPHVFETTGARVQVYCDAGQMVQLKRGEEGGGLPSDAALNPPVFMSGDWVFDTCFDGSHIKVPRWKGNELVWGEADWTQ